MRPIALDTETFLITETEPLPQLVCLSYAPDATCADLVRAEHAPDVLRAVAEDPDALAVFHNAGFDAAILTKADPSLWPSIVRLYDEGRVSCTMIREALAHIERGTLQEESRANKGLLRLETLASEHLGVQLSKGEDSWRLRFGELAHLPLDQWPPEARNYAIADALSTLRVREKQSEKREGRPFPDETLQVRAAFALQLTTAHGIVTDEPTIDAFESSLLEKALAHEAALREEGLVKSDGSRSVTKTRELVEGAYFRLGLPVPHSDPSSKFPYGQIKYDSLTLEESGDPRLASLAEYNSVLHLLNNYVPVLRSGVDHPIHASYSPLVASGRTSCWKPPLQQLPVYPGLRECFVAREGKVLVACDGSLAELRALAQITYSWFGFSDMRDALIAGRDLHTDLAASILGISYDDAIAMKRAKDPRMVGDDSQPGARKIAKSSNFGLAGGLGSPAFSHYLRGSGIKKSVDDCAAYKELWLNKWTEMRAYFQQIGKVCGDFGEKRLEAFGSGRVRGGLRFTQGANTMFQSYVADIFKAIAWKLVRACYYEERSPLFGARPLVFMHDENIVECDAEAGHDVATELERITVETAQEWTPDVPQAADAHLMRHWTKSAEAVRDEHGRLIPWEERPR